MCSAPLSNAVTYILLSLAERDLHGYGMMQATARLSGGRYKIGPGTLYDNLRALLAGGLVSEAEIDPEGAESRRMYHLTGAGERALSEELQRLESVVEAGRARLAPGRTREV